MGPGGSPRLFWLEFSALFRGCWPSKNRDHWGSRHIMRLPKELLRACSRNILDSKIDLWVDKTIFPGFLFLHHKCQGGRLNKRHSTTSYGLFVLERFQTGFWRKHFVNSTPFPGRFLPFLFFFVTFELCLTEWMGHFVGIFGISLEAMLVLGGKSVLRRALAKPDHLFSTGENMFV